MTSLEHPEQPAHMLEGQMEWIQPIPTPYALVEPAQIVEVTSSEEDPAKELEVQELEPDMEMMLAPEPAAEFVEDSRPGWLVESDESPSYDYRLEWMAPAYAHLYPRSPIAPILSPAAEVISSRSSFEFAVIPDLDRPGPYHTVRVVMSSDSSLEGIQTTPVVLTLLRVGSVSRYLDGDCTFGEGIA